MRNAKILSVILAIALVFGTTVLSLTGCDTGGGGGGGGGGAPSSTPKSPPRDGGPNFPVFTGDLLTVANLDEWYAAKVVIANGGNDKSYIINITDDFSIPASTDNTFGSVTGVSIAITGNQNLTLQADTKGNLLLIGNDQTVIIQDIKLIGHNNNNDSLVKVLGSFTMLDSASVSGNTNADGNGGGVYIENGSSFIMDGYATVSGNTANKGGGLYINADSHVEILGGNVYGSDTTIPQELRNTSVSSGAALYITDGTNEYGFDDNIIQEPNTYTFDDITANGSLEETTTQLELTFDREIPGLTVNDIILSDIPGAKNITKTLSGSGPTYILTIGNVWVGGELTVTVTKQGINIDPASMTVEIISASVFNVDNLDQWNNARTAIANGGNDRSYAINITNDFSVPGSEANTFGSVANVDITISGNHTLTDTYYPGTREALLQIGTHQTVIIQDINLKSSDSRSPSYGANTYGDFIMQGSAGVTGFICGVKVSESGTFKMYDNTFIYSATTTGTRVGDRANHGTFMMYDNASVHHCGQGVEIFSGCTFTMYNNSSVHDSAGYGVWLKYYGATFTMHDNASVHDSKKLSGVCMEGGTFTMRDNSTIYGNAERGLYLCDDLSLLSTTRPGIFRMAGGTIYGNTAAPTLSNGMGALYVNIKNGTATCGGPDGTANSFGTGKFTIYDTITQTPGGSNSVQVRPVTPTNVRLVNRTEYTATINWNAVPNATEYLVYCRVKMLLGDAHYLVGKTSETHFTDGTSPTCYYSVTARNVYGESGRSTTVYAEYKAAKRGVTATQLSKGGVLIEWSRIDNGGYLPGLFAGYQAAYIVKRDNVRVGKVGIPFIGTPVAALGRNYFVDNKLLRRGEPYNYSVYQEIKGKILLFIHVSTNYEYHSYGGPAASDWVTIQ